ncbi:hypothetical protein AA313_de0208537 [Arthrobotrys entomopaga]|nr:hypothetical protein AA313_de0208537 [Arthrobotrys entomopaga]
MNLSIRKSINRLHHAPDHWELLDGMTSVLQSLHDISSRPVFHVGHLWDELMVHTRGVYRIQQVVPPFVNLDKCQKDARDNSATTTSTNYKTRVAIVNCNCWRSGRQRPLVGLDIVIDRGLKSKGIIGSWN